MAGTVDRSRRAVLTAAAGTAAALAANAAFTRAPVMAAADPLIMETANAATAKTSLTAPLESDTVLAVANSAVSGGRGISAEAPSAGTGVFGTAGDPSEGPSDTSLTGVFGFATAGDVVFGAGVWGDSPDVGVYGTGGTGVLGDGDSTGWGVYGVSGSGYAVIGESDTGIGLKGYSASGYGLYVTGKVKFYNRSGRAAVSAGRTSYTKSSGLSGVTSSSIVIAVLQTAESGTWVRAAVAGTGKFTVYFNKALPSSSVVGWLILN